MSFELLLGNQQLKENLQAGIRRGNISHFYLISGPKGAGKMTLARLLSAAILCKDTERPCLQCAACRKVMADTHPDLITVRDPEHKNVPVKIIRQVREEMFVKPNEAEHKIYLLPQPLGEEGQNALLKILEEPPSYGVFILLSENPENLLVTVRSRSTQLRLQSLPEEILRHELTREFPDAAKPDIDAAIWRSGGFLGQAKELLQDGVALSEQTAGFVQSFAGRDSLALLQILVSMEKWKRDAFSETLAQWIQLLQQALLCRSGMPVLSENARALAAQRSPQDLNNAIKHLKKAIDYAQGNISVAAICGHLEWVLR